MGQDLAPLAVPGAVLAFQIAWAERPVCTAMFEASAIEAHLARIERKNKISPEERDEPGVHGHMHRLALLLIRDNPDPALTDWVPVAGASLLWSGLHHPGLGARNVARAAELLRTKGRATMAFEIRNGGLWFEVFDLELPAGAPTPVPAEGKPDVQPGVHQSTGTGLTGEAATN